MTASSFPVSSEASNYDEVSMQQSMLFSDCLKDLKNLRTQLYSAAEYFELSYSNDDQKQIVVETLQDYAVKALVNTVDHLGSITYKVNDLLDAKVDEVSRTELRISCIEQRLRTCQEYMDREGLSQQSLIINTPKFHKRYILPAGETTNGPDGAKLKYGCSLDDEDDWRQFKNAIRATIRDTPPASNNVQRNRGRSPSPSPRPPPQRSGTFHFTSTTTKKELDKRTESPNRFPLVRSGSLASRPVTPKGSRPTTPNPIWPSTPSFAGPGRQFPSEPRKSASMRLHAGRKNSQEVEQQHPHPGKGKHLLKALLSRRKSRKDEMLYTYLDEY
ncbi:hypothetical protein MLD38_015705 [Melastoma candidum]|uniref:Uncharacterized protein n=1 Tax=Melastoma candidum TaxID=119954 RepID=A0ACB9RK22_9MYRT|nr:hypothetical protein MLD38_015705 [Melastoma candidum]